MDSLELMSHCSNCEGKRNASGIVENEDEFQQWNLERWHDRAFKHKDPWTGEKSAVLVWT